ncbi:mandelate racemase/muconate lactonizing enzyme family protein [Exilibacterium tricleocarpae]|uniref:Mandelate racemase/muconate lactonizing enzyme family protein n=1 Tax=Exilibacterium tricleocarpae TaxID=2591008 RepID=A0A545T001_9GAMM|nr:mandelate racemase/muconate lactonizing enzyme family protein [Exilibacterium tricleocarpae]TQV70556.1 mandelate racemase/muconate lactonizing enzyme family protein [Exilibacterium tricleocarpae]
MKVNSVETFAIEAKPIDNKGYWGARAWGQGAPTRHLSAEYPPKIRRTFLYSPNIETVIIRITTDEGLVGWGEAKAPVAARVTKALIDQLLAPVVIGQNPCETVRLWETLYAGMRVRGHQSGFWLEAISGIDIALWDIAGQFAGWPIHIGLGGAFRKPVRVYASGIPTLPGNATAEAFDDLANQALEVKDKGFTALKMALGRDIPGDVQSAEVVRQAVGPEFDLYADAAGSYDAAQAITIGKDLERLNFGFFEMPIPPENKDGYARLAARLDIPLALDSLMTRFETLDFLRRGGLHLVQPDVCRAGGITECRRIAELADAFGVAYAPHCSIGSAVHFAASVHLGAAMPNTMTCEYWIGNNPLGNRTLNKPLDLENGRLNVPGGTGLGLEINAEALLSAAVKC